MFGVSDVYVNMYVHVHAHMYPPTLGETIFLGLLPPMSGRLVFGVPSLSEADTSDTSARFVNDESVVETDCTLRMLAASALCACVCVYVCMYAMCVCVHLCMYVCVYVCGRMNLWLRRT